MGTVDVGELLREARLRAGLSQRLVAKHSGASQAQVARYESGSVSPTVTTLDRLLAACGLQLRVKLEPLLAHVDARVDAMLTGEVIVDDADELARLRRNLDDPKDNAGSAWKTPDDVGPPSWAFDGSTALQLQGLAVPSDNPTFVIALDDAARWWLRRCGANLQDPQGRRLNELEATFEQLAEVLRWPFLTLVGMPVVRLVHELPATVRLAVSWDDQPVPVATVDAVEQHWPEHAEALGRLRQRRGSPQPGPRESGTPAAL